MIKKKTISSFLVMTTLLSSIGGISVLAKENKPTPTPRCYPAYMCYSKNKIPTNYTLLATNPDRGLGNLIGSSIVGALGFIPHAGLPSFLASLGIGANEYLNGFASYRIYIKRHPDNNKKAYLKTVYYRYPHFNGESKTVVTTF